MTLTNRIGVAAATVVVYTQGLVCKVIGHKPEKHCTTYTAMYVNGFGRTVRVSVRCTRCWRRLDV